EAAAPPRCRPRVPELCAVPAPDGIRQHRFWAAAAPGGKTTDRRTRWRHSPPRRLAGNGSAVSDAIVGRPAAARRDRPLAGAGTADPDVRRAAVEPRLQVAHPDARRAEA